MSPDRTAKDAFLHLNEDRDGAIDVEELREGLRSIGEPLTDGEFAVLVRRLDDNATGKVNYRGNVDCVSPYAATTLIIIGHRASTAHTIHTPIAARTP